MQPSYFQSWLFWCSFEARTRPPPMDRIPLADPRASYIAHRTEIDEALSVVFNGPTYILGDVVEGFEREFAQFIGVAHGVGVNNGTDAIHLALRALGIGPGDEVVTASHTAVATVAAIRMCGAEPVLADVTADTYTISPDRVRELITDRTKAVIAVHLYGHPADLGALQLICLEFSLKLIEDCAQAHAAELHGRRLGSWGDVSTFSFYPTKNLGAIGDAGMVLTNDPDLAARVRALRQYGWESPQYSLVEGWNSRLDPLQAAVLSVKLRHLPAATERRRKLAKGYINGLSSTPMILPVELPGAFHAYHLFVVRLRDRAERDTLRLYLEKAGISSGVHYPYPVHLQPAYRQGLRSSAMEITEQVAGTVLSLPLFPELQESTQAHIIAELVEFFNDRP